MRRIAILAFVAALAFPAAAVAQEADDIGSRYEADYEMTDPDWREYRFHVAGWAGKISGGTNVGFTENLFFQVAFEQGSDTAFGGRVGWVFAPRFDVELEYGNASPGLNAVITDLSGQGRTVAEFADLDLSWISGSVNYSMIDRSRRVVPYLTLGVGALSVSSSAEPTIDTTEPLLLFGGGLRVRVIEVLALRVDARGLRSGFGSKQEDPTQPAVLLGEFNGTNLLWSAGLELRF